MASSPGVQIGRSERRMRYERIVTTLAVVHAASQSTGGPVNRGLSPFEPEPVVPRAGSVPATMTAVTSCTTTTTTALPYTTRERDDFLCMSTTAQARLIIRDPRAASAAYVTWHGPNGEILGTAEAPRRLRLYIACRMLYA